MDAHLLVTPLAAASERRRQLDRRRLVQGVVAVSLTGAAVEIGAPRTASAAGATEHPAALSRTVASHDLTRNATAYSCLEASLHVMMQ